MTVAACAVWWVITNRAIPKMATDASRIATRFRFIRARLGQYAITTARAVGRDSRGGAPLHPQTRGATRLRKPGALCHRAHRPSDESGVRCDGASSPKRIV